MDIKGSLQFLTRSNNDRSILIFVFLLGIISGLLINTLWNILKRKKQMIKHIQRRISAKTECKMVLCVRSDLKMGKGKMCSQCCHACLSVYEKILKRDKINSVKEPGRKGHTTYLSLWKSMGQKKVVLKVSSLEELREIENSAIKQNLLTATIIDAGRTQIEPNTTTVLAIEPAPEDLLDSITGKLSLL